MLGSARTAGADDTEQRFHAATALLADGKEQAAVDALLALVRDQPRSRFADDALFAAAELVDEKLGDPARAAELYERIASEYPDSRVASAAAKRGGELRRAVGPSGDGSAFVARFTAIKARRSELSAAEAISQAELLLNEATDWAGAPEVALWIADQYFQDNDMATAIERYDRVIATWPNSPAAKHARLAHADASQVRQKQDSEDRVGAIALAVFALGLVALAGLLRAGAGSWKLAAAALWPPPTEAIYFAPIATLLVAAAQTGYEPVGIAVAYVCVGALIVTWISGAGQSRRRARGRVVVHAALTTVAIAALCVVAIWRADLFDLVSQTVRYGPDS